MTTKTDDEEVIERVLELDAKAVRGPWRLTAGYEARTVQVELPCINGLRAWFTIASVEPSLEEQEWTEGALSYPESNDRATLIAEYRTAAPDLARRLRERNVRIAVLEKDFDQAVSVAESAVPIMHEQRARIAELEKQLGEARETAFDHAKNAVVGCVSQFRNGNPDNARWIKVDDAVAAIEAARRRSTT